MKNRLILILSALILVACFVMYFQQKSLKNKNIENERLTSNVNVLNKNYSSYKTAYGHETAKVEALKYTQKEMKTYESKLQGKIKELNIKPKNVLSAAEIGTKTVTEIKTEIQYVDSTKCLYFTDKFNTLTGCFTDSTFSGTIENRDSLTTIVDKIPKHKFLCWTWGIKAIELNIMSQNPNTIFTYLKYIELK